jgi:FkbM family methyltransferase
MMPSLSRLLRRAPAHPGRDYGGAPVLRAVISYNSFGAYCVPLSSQHRPAAQRILRGEVWEEATLAYLAAECGDGDVVHAGTYFGDFLPALSRAARPGGRVWGFEPNPENYRCADITMRLNGLTNVTLNHAALGASQGEARIATTDARGRPLGGASHVVDRVSPGEVVENVPVMAIDEVLPRDRDVSLIQLDVEGFEDQALLGAMGTIRRCRPVLVLETVPDSAWLAEHLAPMGYSVERTIDANTVLRA